MPEVALSTMWGLGRFSTLSEFFHEASRAGFTRFELNHGVSPALLNAVSLKGCTIASIHEPCPADPSAGELKRRNWLISARDEERRQEGVRAIERSIDLAQKLGAAVVIVHPGRVEIDTSAEDALFRLCRAGQAGTDDYQRMKEALVCARGAQAPKNLESVRRSLIELAPYARARGIRLGLENRYHYHEIPLPDELDELLELGDEDVVGYWHDVGHAQVLDNMGFNHHEEWLRRFALRIIGTHLHDVIGVDDHCAAGLGNMNWDMVASYLPAAALRTCEFQNNHSAQQITAGVQWLIKTGCL